MFSFTNFRVNRFANVPCLRRHQYIIIIIIIIIYFAKAGTNNITKTVVRQKQPGSSRRLYL